MGDESNFGNLSTKKVIIFGGGLSGMAAARRLLDQGFHVTLVEKRPFLGGRAYSFRDVEEGIEVDNGQHVFLGCYTSYIEYLKSIGALEKTYVQSSLRVEVLLDGRVGKLFSMPVLGNFHLLPSLLRYPHIGFVDKVLFLYGLLRVKLTKRKKSWVSLSDESAYDWLRRHHQTDRTIDNLWNLFILPALNDDVRTVSADMALMVFQEALLKKIENATVGMSRVGLTSLNGEPAQQFIEKHGGELIMGKAVRSLKYQGDAICGAELIDGRVLQGDAYVSALPYEVLLQVLPHEVSTSDFFSRVSGLRTSPIVGIHIWYEKTIMDQEFVAILNNPVQWVFNKSKIHGLDGSSGQYICISLSGAWQYIDMPKEDIVRLFTKEMGRLFPRANDAGVKRVLVVKERNATFRSEPGSAKYRLPQMTPLSNLYLAGDWTETGWPSTMEGAVRSGFAAADLVILRA